MKYEDFKRKILFLISVCYVLISSCSCRKEDLLHFELDVYEQIKYEKLIQQKLNYLKIGLQQEFVYILLETESRKSIGNCKLQRIVILSD